MLLSVWTEYYDFFIITIGIIVGMILTYFLFFRPRNRKDNTIEYVEPVTNDLEVEELNGEVIEENTESLEDYDEEMPNDFEMGEYSNIYESIEPSIENIEDEIPEGIEIVHEDDDYQPEEPEEVEEAIQNRVHLFGQIDLKPEIDPETQIDEIIEDVLKISEQKPAQVGGKYHVLYKKSNKKWHVKREGEGTLPKQLLTQDEAIAYATIKALENETTIVVHDEDGRISKYKF